MKALLKKDAYVLWRQMRIFAVALVVLAVCGGTFNHIFLVVWCSMLPYTAMAYDERSHWDQLAAMMPYSRREIVLSKYVLGWLCMGAAELASLVIGTAASAVTHSPMSAGLLLTSFFSGILALDITLPLIFRFGVEKGRLGFMLIIFATAIAGGGLAGVAGEIQRVPVQVVTLVPLVAVVATVISIPLSLKLYSKRA